MGPLMRILLFHQVLREKPTSLTWYANFAYSQRTSASSGVKFGCNSYGFSVRISCAPAGLVMVREERCLLSSPVSPSRQHPPVCPMITFWSQPHIPGRFLVDSG
ncbi:hypothetical protein Ac2012v2_001920 [Leucoagaricus gongylophorus]